jgi:hypothetical protein
VLCAQDSDGRINSHAFLSEFFRLGNIERKKKLTFQQNLSHKIDKQKQTFQIQREKSLQRLSVYALAPRYTKEEAKSAYDKFALMALNHDAQNATPLLVGEKPLPDLTSHRALSMVVISHQKNLKNN